MPPSPLEADLNRMLLIAGNQSKKEWWENYLKGFDMKFYGVPMARIRYISQSFWDDNELGIDFILGLFKIPVAEPKLAAIILLETRYLDKVDETDVPRLAALFDDGHISDWHICDWFCTKFLSNLLRRKPAFKRILRGWNHGTTIWQRRASAVMFVPLAKSCKLEEAKEMMEIASAGLGPTRFEQTGVAWLMAELSISHKELVAVWVEEHKSILSKEALERASKRLPKRGVARETSSNEKVKKRKNRK
jgi:3-methyladenine DNA glycosylase AlkD